ncbi:phage antirepressor N-terminal domain-containing protein [Haemophilus sp. Marseille-Q0026]|uniref:phage antirepressor N-terminal domain-containing protein n=1 Tax=Haemophilus sp. Marseille-Q0026 TaxID=2866580 RepID=UPI001CF85F50|nr:phage antirepressor N-terminal domain-containing protein [Haemophilus sp. Marseille-Q0026]
MANQISTQTISFNNQSLITAEQNGNHYVAMKPICENIGIQWESQYNRIRRDDVLNSVIFIMNMTGSDSKNYQIGDPNLY